MPQFGPFAFPLFVLARMASIPYNLNMGKNRLLFSDELRGLIDASGMSRYRIAKQLGIAESTLSRFMSGERGLTMKCLDALAALLDLHVSSGKQAADVARVDQKRKRKS
jgi:hypothetical protein